MAEKALFDPVVKKTSRDPELVRSCFDAIVNKIHTTVVATVDDDGLPVTCVIDMMDHDDAGLYFLTNCGKAFYDRLVKRGALSLSATDGKPTMECTAVTVQGKVREVDETVLARLMEKNPYMYELYPTEEQRATLRAFQIYDGSGNLYELGAKPPRQTYFAF